MTGDPQAVTAPPVVRLSGISKSYPGVRALRGVDLALRAGEIHCLVGENGAGKSTLMRVLTGAIRPDTGEIAIDGEAHAALDPASALAHGIGIVYQELDLVPAMTVAENVFLGHEPAGRWGLVDRAAMRARTRDILAGFDVAIAPEARVRDLGPAERQLVQIAKTLSHPNRVLILDEPTATLTDNEVEHLFALLGRFRARGMAIVHISHRLEEVLRIGDVVSVMRDGERVLTRPVAGMDRQALIAAMVGRHVEESAPRAPPGDAPVALAVEGLGRRGEFEGIAFEVREGEVLGLAGLIGAGRSALLETIFGLRRADAGRVLVRGAPVAIRDPAAAVALGMGLVPEERRANGVITGRGVADNLILPMLDRLSGPAGLDRTRIDTLVDKQIADLGIKTASARTLAGTLSGGNQQKIVIGKWLAAGARILLLDEPTRGIDIAAKAEIYRLIAALAREGVAVVVASSELPELLAITGRIVVLAAGRQTALLDTASTDQLEIMRHAFGEPAAPAAG